MTSAAPKPVRSVGAGRAGNVNGTSGTSKIAAGRRALPTCSGKSKEDDLVQGLGIGQGEDDSLEDDFRFDV